MNPDQIVRMSTAIQQFLEKKQLVDSKPKDLMPFLIEKGFFEKDHREGLPLRNVLRALDESNKLYLIPQVRVERKAKNRSWYFNAVKV